MCAKIMWTRDFGELGMHDCGRYRAILIDAALPVTERSIVGTKVDGRNRSV